MTIFLYFVLYLKGDGNYSELQTTDMPAKLSYASDEASFCGFRDYYPHENMYSCLSNKFERSEFLFSWGSE